MKNKTLLIVSSLILLAPLVALANPVPLPLPNFSSGGDFLASLKISAMFLAAAIIFEVFVGYIYCLATKTPKRILLWIILANLISFPIFSYLLAPFLDFIGFFGILILEALVVVFEGLFIYYFNRQYIKVERAIILSLIMNVVSFVVAPMFFLMLYEINSPPVPF